MTSRQPVSLTPGGPDTHVRLRWDGKDALALGAPPSWTFVARCITVTDYPSLTFSRPSGGRFELLVPVPSDLTVGQKLEFRVEATGPDGKKLGDTFQAEVVAPPQKLPRKAKLEVPEASAQRRPPYDLKYITTEEWETTEFWDGKSWSAEDAGCFHEPTSSMPLVLIINTDMALVKDYQKSLVDRKLEPTTINERVTKYTSHVAFHLYQMYLGYRAAMEAAKRDESTPVPPTSQMHGEVNRVATTLIKVMQVSR